MLPPSPFQEAVAQGDLAAMEALFQPKDVLVCPYNQYTKFSALMIAAENRHLHACQWLVAHGASVLDFDMTEKTPLHHACRGGNAQIVEYFLGMGANINAVCEEGHHPIIDAARKGHCQAVRTLVKHGASMEVRLRAGMTPLMFAAMFHEFNTVETLLELGADPHTRTERRENMLHVLAAEYPRLGMFSRLDKDVAAATPGRQHQCLALFDRLLALGVDPTQPTIDACDVMDVACAGGAVELMERLFTEPSRLRGAMGTGYIHLAARQGHVGLFRWLLARGAAFAMLPHERESAQLKPAIQAEIAALELSAAHCPAAAPGPKRRF